MRILTVCLGNICRSPTAEAVLRARAPATWQIDSAGTADWHTGNPPYGPMQDAARPRGYELAPLRARRVTTADFTNFDLILAMDAQNLADLQAIAPANTTARITLFADADVPDPYYTRDFGGALSIIEAAATRWLP